MTTMQRILSVLFVLATLVSAPVSAIDLGEAKAKGLVGEMANGYLGVVKGGGDVQALVKSINDQRLQMYQQIAQKNNTSLQNVEALAGKKAIEKTPAGQYVNVGGGWRKK